MTARPVEPHAVPEFDIAYRLAWRARTARAGAHRSTQAGSGGLFRDLTSLMDARDPRRIDMRQSIRDPFEAIHVRRFEQQSAIAVTMLADVSASMSFTGRSRKIRLAGELARGIAASAYRTGDTFMLASADRSLRPELTTAPIRSRAVQASAAEALGRFTPSQPGTAGLIEAAKLIGKRRGLVFLVSDFLMAEADIVAIFEALARHDVVAIAVHDSAEIEGLPSWGLVQLNDLETRRSRLVVLRPSLKEAWRLAHAHRQAVYRDVARRYGREPFEVTDRIDWNALGAHLVSGAH